MYYILALHGLAIVLLVTVLVLLRHDCKIRNQLNIQKGKEGAFVIIIHDLSTLLTSMHYYTDMLLKQEYGSLKVSQIELLHNIEISLTKAKDLCRKLHKPFAYKTIRKKHTKLKSTRKQK